MKTFERKLKTKTWKSFKDLELWLESNCKTSYKILILNNGDKLLSVNISHTYITVFYIQCHIRKTILGKEKIKYYLS